ncbi:MAG TPA: sigma-70 family RNA polymerase sigma factor, partial [Jatrophihabitans sp.]
SHLGPRELADDLTQETYARAFAALHRFAGRSSARTWLLGIARHVCVDAVRAAVRRRAHDGGDVTVLATLASRTTADPADAVTTRALLEALSPERREALVLTQVVGLSYAEAAEICRCPVGTIRSRVARGREDLLGGYGEESVAR